MRDTEAGGLDGAEFVETGDACAAARRGPLGYRYLGDRYLGTGTLAIVTLGIGLVMSGRARARGRWRQR